jgi:predicted RecB family nuclease
MNENQMLTEELFSDYLKCRYKAHLKLTGATAEPPDYARLQQLLSDEYRERASNEWLRTRRTKGVTDNPASLPEAIASGVRTITGAIATDAGESCRLDALERVPPYQLPSGAHYNPVLFVRRERPSADDRLLLGYETSILARIQGATPAVGKIIHGSQLRVSRIELGPSLQAARAVIEEMKQIRDGTAAPPLRLNKHCAECEFRQRCRAAAVDKGDLSLLSSLSAKEISAHNQKGIFTVTQLSYTFRPGRMKRIIEAGGGRHDPALQALAIREGTIYITQRQPIADTKIKVFLDVEGLTDPDRYYLIGLLIVEGSSSRQLNFWADQPGDEPAIWAAFLEVMAGVGKDFTLYHYGSYDSRFLRQMAKLHGGDPGLLARMEKRSVNVLTLIHGRVYFPVYGNDLKSVAGYLGFRWSSPDSSGLQAIAWRHHWQATREDALKQTLLVYNQDDCSALQRVVEALRFLGTDDPPVRSATGLRVVSVSDMEVPRGHKFCDPEYVIPEFERIAKCSYFDYQRNRVLFRTSPTVKQVNLRKKRQRRSVCKVNQVIEYGGTDRCPRCGANDFVVHGHNSRLVIDLKPIGGGLKRWVTQHKARQYLCRRCKGIWISDDFLAAFGLKPGRPQRHGWTLCGWVAYATIVLRQTNEATVESLSDLFGIPMLSTVVSKLRSQAADHYRGAYASLLAKLRSGRLVHVDETWAKVKGADKRGYVWVFASPEVAVYVYSPTRDGDVLRETLAGFTGVLVSDFYAAYDTMDCPQQKCLVHLLRDLNDDLLKHPFDEELKQLGGWFASLMQAIVQTIDRYGLTRLHLHKHKKDVDRFYRQLAGAAYSSETARHFRQRFLYFTRPGMRHRGGIANRPETG